MVLFAGIRFAGPDPKVFLKARFGVISETMLMRQLTSTFMISYLGMLHPLPGFQWQVKIKTLEDPLTALTKNESLLGGHYQRLAGAPKSIRKHPQSQFQRISIEGMMGKHSPTSLRLLKVEITRILVWKIPGSGLDSETFYPNGNT